MILFEVKIPLQSITPFQLFRIQPMPILQEDDFYFIQPSTDYLITNLQRTLYYPLFEIELLRCTQRREGVYACQQKHPLFKLSSGNSSCEMNLSKHRGISSNCTIQKGHGSGLWSQLTGTNKWLFVTNGSRTIDIICDNRLYSTPLERAGIIHFNAQCTIDQSDSIIRTFNPSFSHVNVSFTPAFNLSKILETKGEELHLENLRYDDKSASDNIDAQIRNLQTSALKPSFNHHDIHHYSISYCTLILIIVVCIWFSRRRNVKIPRLTFCQTNLDQAPDNNNSGAPECSQHEP